MQLMAISILFDSLPIRLLKIKLGSHLKAQLKTSFSFPNEEGKKESNFVFIMFDF
jgi:hypothetical protein